MMHRQGLKCFSLWIALATVAAPASAINVMIDYSYDTNHFFSNNNPQGAVAAAQAKAALESAASFFTNILNDTLSSIQTPPPLHSSVFDGVWTWEWKMKFNSPASGDPIAVLNPTVPADRYVIFAGADGLSGSIAGMGGPGGLSWASTPSGGFTQAEDNQGNATTQQFITAVEQRGESTGFATWGGTISFDRDGSTSWHYNHTTQPSGNVVDFYSVAIHELGHALGFGSSDEFQALVSGSGFTGANAKALNSGANVPLADNAHWANGTMSVVYGTSTSQEAAMAPSILNGTRKRFTELDAAALKDIGWEVIPIVIPGNDGDYNNNGFVDAADYVLWRNTLGQNVTPGSGADGDGSGNVGGGDYTHWRMRFGMAVGSTSGLGLDGSGTLVPEPTSIALLTAGSVIGAMFRRRMRVNN